MPVPPNMSMVLTPQELDFINQHYGGAKSAAVHAALQELMDTYQQESTMTTYTFTLADKSTQPYAWMIEGDVTRQDVAEMTPEAYVEAHAHQSIAALNPGDDDEAVYQQWRDDTDEYEQAVAYLNKWIVEAE